MLIAKFDTTDIEQKVSAFETKYNIHLPGQYRKFLLRYNGGYTPNTEFKVTRRRIEDVTHLYGFDVKDKEVTLDNHFWQKYFVEKGYLPFGIDCFGNEYCIGVDAKKWGKIYFYDHELQRTQLVREDFKSFVASCKSEKIGRVRSIAEREASMAAKGRSEFVTDGLRRAWQKEIDFYGNMVQIPVIVEDE